MDTLVLLLIFLLSLTYCKKEEQSKNIIEEKKQTITGIYEIYPSYEKKYIEFESNGDCKFYTKDKIHRLLLLYLSELFKNLSRKR
jgi:hypothetical protein